MKIYRLGYRREDDEHAGYEFFTNKKVARRENKTSNPPKSQADAIDTLYVELTKKGVVSFLNAWASHPDNG